MERLIVPVTMTTFVYRRETITESKYIANANVKHKYYEKSKMCFDIMNIVIIK